MPVLATAGAMFAGASELCLWSEVIYVMRDMHLIDVAMC